MYCKIQIFELCILNKYLNILNLDILNKYLKSYVSFIISSMVLSFSSNISCGWPVPCLVHFSILLWLSCPFSVPSSFLYSRMISSELDYQSELKNTAHSNLCEESTWRVQFSISVGGINNGIQIGDRVIGRGRLGQDWQKCRLVMCTPNPSS